MKKWQPGDRVTRQMYMDDGTWIEQGDTCLDESPLRHGVVLYRSDNRDDAVRVLFDDGTENTYLDHGVSAE